MLARRGVLATALSSEPAALATSRLFKPISGLIASVLRLASATRPPRSLAVPSADRPALLALPDSFAAVSAALRAFFATRVAAVAVVAASDLPTTRLAPAAAVVRTAGVVAAAVLPAVRLAPVAAVVRALPAEVVLVAMVWSSFVAQPNTIASVVATSAGLSLPSISTVFSSESSQRPPPLSSAAASLMRLRTLFPASTGARKRTLSKP